MLEGWQTILIRYRALWRRISRGSSYHELQHCHCGKYSVLIAIVSRRFLGKKSSGMRFTWECAPAQRFDHPSDSQYLSFTTALHQCFRRRHQTKQISRDHVFSRQTTEGCCTSSDHSSLAEVIHAAASIPQTIFRISAKSISTDQNWPTTLFLAFRQWPMAMERRCRATQAVSAIQHLGAEESCRASSRLEAMRLYDQALGTRQQNLSTRDE
jgi:hypothetical protein